MYLISKTDPHRENMKDDYSKIATGRLKKKRRRSLKSGSVKMPLLFFVQIDDEYKSCKDIMQLLQPVNN